MDIKTKKSNPDTVFRDKRAPDAAWEEYLVDFPTVDTDVTIEHTLGSPDVVYSVVDASVPLVVYRGLRPPQSNFITLRSTLVGEAIIRLSLTTRVGNRELLSHQGYAPPASATNVGPSSTEGSGIIPTGSNYTLGGSIAFTGVNDTRLEYDNENLYWDDLDDILYVGSGSRNVVGGTLAVTNRRKGLGGVFDADIIDGGDGYTVGNTLTLLGGNGAATVPISTIAGPLLTFTIAGGGAGYTVNDVLILTNSQLGVNAQITVTTVAAGVITAATLLSGGSLYLNGETVGASGGTGAGATFTVSTVSPGIVRGLGAVSAAGASYPAGINTFETSGGTGTGATVAAHVLGTGFYPAVVLLNTQTNSGFYEDIRIQTQDVATQDQPDNLILAAGSDGTNAGAELELHSHVSGYAYAKFTKRLGVEISPTAYLHVKAGTTSLAPVKLTSGTNLTTAEAGAIEYNGTNLFFTRTGTTRENVIVAVDNAAAPSTSLITTNLNKYGGDTNYLGDPNRWLSVNILGTVYKLPLYT